MVARYQTREMTTALPRRFQGAPGAGLLKQAGVSWFRGEAGAVSVFPIRAS